MSTAALVAVTLSLTVSVAASADPVSTGHSGWFWGSPTPQGKDLSAVAFEGDTGYAVGRFGTALRSDDDGHTWTGLASGTLDDLTAVQELSPTAAVVSGGCTVAETTDGGTSFRMLPEVGGPTCGDGIAAIAFSDPDNGYIALRDGEVLLTDDGGNTLQARTPVPVGLNGRLADVAFADANDGVAVTADGAIERTTDAARSWTRVAAPAVALTSVTFATPQVAFATPQVVYAVGAHGAILRSQDGGATWAAAHDPDSVSPAAFVDLDHISCTTAETCLFSGSSTAGPGQAVLRTVDGGATTTDVTPGTGRIVDAVFAAGDAAVGVGLGGAVTVSADAGQSFPEPAASGLAAGVSGASRTPLRTGGTDGDAYLSGVAGVIEATTDGGQSWSPIRVPGGAAIVDTAFPSTSNGYELGNDGAVRATRNGGRSWRTLAATVRAHAQIAATDARHVVIAGPLGLRRSTDAGASFAPVSGAVTLEPHRDPVRISRLALTHVASSGARVVAWSQRAVVESLDGGAHWGAIRLPRRTRITGLSFVSGRVGWITDVAGELLSTRDRGATWTVVSSLGVRADGSFAFADARDGYLVTPTGSDAVGVHATVLPFDVLVTTDGGRSWTPQVVDGAGPGASDPRAIATIAAAGSHAYYLSPGAGTTESQPSLLSTSNGGRSPRRSSLTFTAHATRNGGRQAHRYRLSIHGHLTPAPGPNGSRVMLSERRRGHDWSSRLVTVGADGAFQATLRGLRGRTDVVAYALGDGRVDGAGAFREIRAPRAAQRSTK